MEMRYPEHSLIEPASPEVIAAWEGARLRAFRTILTYAREHRSNHALLETELDNTIGLIDWGLIYGPDEVSPIHNPSFASDLGELVDKVGDILQNRLSDYGARISMDERQTVSKLNDMTTELEKVFKPEIDKRRQTIDAASQELHNEVLPAIEEWERLANALDSPQAMVQFKEQYFRLTRRLTELKQIIATAEEELIAIKGAMAKHQAHATETMVKGETDLRQVVNSLSDMDCLKRWQRELPNFTSRWLSRWRLKQEQKRALPWQQVLAGKALNWVIAAFYLVRTTLQQLISEVHLKPGKQYHSSPDSLLPDTVPDSEHMGMTDLESGSLATKWILEALNTKRSAWQPTTKIEMPEYQGQRSAIEDDIGIRALRTRLEYVPYDCDSRWELARRYVGHGAYRQALEEYLELLHQRPEYHEARMELVDCYVALGMWDKALVELKYMTRIQRYAKEAKEMLNKVAEIARLERDSIAGTDRCDGK